MKKIIFFALSIVFASHFSYSQKTDVKVEVNCYNKWAIKFEERGAEEVKDGVYTDVIITSRVGAKAVCNSGKAEVLKGKVVKFYTLLSDGTYEEVKRSWKDKSNENVTITNGVSKALITAHNEVINIIWPSSMKAKKAKPIAAPEPADD